MDKLKLCPFCGCQVAFCRSRRTGARPAADLAGCPGRREGAMDFATNRRMITPEEHTALRIACQLPAKVPTPAQSKKLIALLERLYEEGFKL